MAFFPSSLPPSFAALRALHPPDDRLDSRGEVSVAWCARLAWPFKAIGKSRSARKRSLPPSGREKDARPGNVASLMNLQAPWNGLVRDRGSVGFRQNPHCRRPQTSNATPWL